MVSIRGQDHRDVANHRYVSHVGSRMWVDPEDEGEGEDDGEGGSVVAVSWQCRGSVVVVEVLSVSLQCRGALGGVVAVSRSCQAVSLQCRGADRQWQVVCLGDAVGAAVVWVQAAVHREHAYEGESRMRGSSGEW